MTDYKTKQEEIRKAIYELDKAIEFLRNRYTELNRKSLFFIDKPLIELKDTIDELVEARRRLESKKLNYRSMELLYTPIIDSASLANLIIDGHNSYVNWWR